MCPEQQQARLESKPGSVRVSPFTKGTAQVDHGVLGVGGRWISRTMSSCSPRSKGHVVGVGRETEGSKGLPQVREIFGGR